MYKGIFDKHYDAVILGGGLCGIGAGLAMAGSGKKVLIVERRSSTGWEVTSAFNCTLEASVSPAAEMLEKRLATMGGFRDSRIDPPIFEFLLHELFEEKKIDLLLYCAPVQLTIRENLVTGVIVGHKSGEQVISSKIFIDATEEALLWRQTNLEFVQNQRCPARQAIFFNGIEERINLPILLKESGNARNITVHPSVWEKEACVEFEIPEYSVTSARLAIPDVILYVRKKVPQMKDAIATHSGFEPFPLEATVHLKKRTFRHPYFKNLFGAGIWIIPQKKEREKINTVAGRIRLGENAGDMAARISVKVPCPEKIDLLTSPQYREADVVIAGGGTAGAIAAIASARQGAKTIVLEAGTMLGGIGTGGGIHMYCAGTPGGLQDEVDSRVEKITSVFAGRFRAEGFHPEAKKFVLEQMCFEAGVEVVYQAMATGVETSGKCITGIIAILPSGKTVFRAKAFVDSTGDADIAVMAGAPFTIGREADEVPHCYSQSAGHLDRNGNMQIINFDAGWADPFNPLDLTIARRTGLKHLQKRFGARDRLLYIAPIIGIRQSRQIAGDYCITLKDEIFARRFEDCIGFMHTFYDNHSNDIENQSDEAVLWVWVLGNFSKTIGCEIPYRCLLPKNVEGLLVACRACSMTIDAHYGFRMMRDIQRIGEAAGIAAALSSKSGKTPRELEVRLVQKELRKTGALQESHRPKPAIPEALPKKKEIPASSAELKEILWPLVNTGRDAIPVLKQMLERATPEKKFFPAVALAMYKHRAAVPELIRCVVERDATTAEGPKAAPHWKSAIVMLGRIGSKKAVPCLMDVLSDRKADADALIAAIRALERIKDRSSIPGLLKFLKRRDLPKTRKFQISCGPVSEPVEEDILWQIELAAAEALAILGKPQNRIVKKYLNDPRSYVRRYAGRIAGLKSI